MTDFRSPSPKHGPEQQEESLAVVFRELQIPGRFPVFGIQLIRGSERLNRLIDVLPALDQGCHTQIIVQIRVLGMVFQMLFQSHPVRIQIVQHLKKVNQCICGDIVDNFALSQSTISQHLKQLKEAGLIIGEIEGPRTCYCLNPEAIERFKQAVAAL